MRDFEVYEPVPTSSVPPGTTIIGTRCVLRWKGSTVKARLVCQGYSEQITDRDSIYASTPTFATLNVLLATALSRSYKISIGDISTAFLHAGITSEEPIYVKAPPEYYDKDTTWKLKKAMYRLESAPKS